MPKTVHGLPKLARRVLLPNVFLLSFLSVFLLALAMPIPSFAQALQPSERIAAIDAEIAKLTAAGGAKSDFSRDVWKQLDEALHRIEAKAIPHELSVEGQQQRFNELVARIRANIKHLKTGNVASVATYEDRLGQLQATWDSGKLELGPSEKPMVHWVHYGGGSDSADPDEPLIVNLKIDVKRPVMLMLTSNRKTNWKIDAQEATRVRAIVLGYNGESAECHSGTWVFKRKYGLFVATLRQMEKWQRRPVDEFGQEAEVLMPIFDASEPVTLSPENPSWVRNTTLGRLRRLHAETRAHRNQRFLETEPDLRFPGIKIEYRGSVSAYQTFTTTCDFNLSGLLKETEQPRGMHLWNLTPSGKTTFGIKSGLLVQNTSAKDWPNVAMPTKWPDGQRLRSISYDAKRKRLLALGQGGDLFSLDMDSSKWTRIRKGLAGSIAVVWANDKDEILVLRQRIDPAHTWRRRTSVLFLDRTGQNVKEQELMCGELLQQSPMAGGNELTVSGSYLIAVQPPSSGQELPADPVIRVFDLGTGELLYDHMIDPEDGFAKPGVLPTNYCVLNNRLNAFRDQLQESKAFIKELELLVRTKIDGTVGNMDGDAAVKELLAEMDELAKENGNSTE